ncbi:hypothetical protein BBJ28_00017227 [Nothophytophthora sp. Chile5]|nr:hypothetical protein BBJ28_00017227 [Nothophytophthora sp. Chile5]
MSIARRRLLSSAVKRPRSVVRKRARSLPPLPVVAVATAAAFLLAFPPNHDRVAAHGLLLRSTTLLGILAYHKSDFSTSTADATTTGAAILEQAQRWRGILARGGLEAVQGETIDRLLDAVLQPEDGALERHGGEMLSILVQYAATVKPSDPQHLVQALKKLLKVASGNAELRLSLVALARALGHLTQLQEPTAMSYVDLLQLGDRLLQLQQQHEDGAGPSQAFVVYRSTLSDRDSSSLSEACSSLVSLCSPELPTSMKQFGLWALTALVQGVNRQHPSVWQTQQLKAALSPTFATLLLALPRGHNGSALQLQAATLLDSLLHLARQNPALVTHDTYELWMKQIRFWTGTEIKEQTPLTKKPTWGTRKSRQSDQQGSNTTTERRVKLQLQLTSARCLRTLSTSPQSRRYLCESPETRAALFELTRQIHEMKQQKGSTRDGEMARTMISIQRHVSWTFRNICTGFQSGAVALQCLFDASWTASLLQSRQDLPMSRFFRGMSDLTDLPIVGAEEYESSTEFGWVDILTAWSASTNRQVRENAIASLVYLAEQAQSSSAALTAEQEETQSKQEHILQAWLTSMLQQIRLLSGGELLAVKEMEQIANVSDELTPGNERVLFNSAVVDAGTSALAILAEHHHSELVQQGVVPLMALLTTTSAATPAQHTQCARVLANLVATCCLAIDPGSAVLRTEAAPAVLVNDHVDIAALLAQTLSGKRFLSEIRRWRECRDPMQRSNFYRVEQNLRAYDDVVAHGRLVEDVYCEGVHPIVSRAKSEAVDPSNDSREPPVVDVVFVHGLRGHPFGTWRTDMSSDLEGDNDIWPDVLLAKDLRQNHVPARLVTLGYEAGMVSWSSPWPSLTLQERARVMLSALYAANVGRDRHHPDAPARSVVFITHSMGGLLVKKMLLLEREQHERQNVSSLADSTTGLVFLAVPHFGSDLAKGVRSESVRRLIQTHPAIEDLGADPNGRLEALNDSFKQLGIDCLSVGEERAAPVALGLSAVVVKPDSADPGIGRFYVLPDSDHMTICKAKSSSEPLYQDILQYVVQHATKDTASRLSS